jgi:hypothetical protein
MATENQVDTGLKGSTGSGMFVGSISPSLVTPILGVASATSMNFGGSSLSDYIDNTPFTPTFTCATPGDLSFAYTTQQGFYVRIGNIVFYVMSVRGTPTFTTASGQIQVGGLPITPSQAHGDCLGISVNNSAFTYPVGTTQVAVQTLGAGGNLGWIAFGSAVASSTVTMANITTGVAFNAQYSGSYFV